LQRSPVATLAASLFLLVLVMYGEDVYTIAELSIDDYLYSNTNLYNVSGLPPLLDLAQDPRLWRNCPNYSDLSA
jgi:hypothetical protein